MNDSIVRMRLMILILLSVFTAGVWLLPIALEEKETAYLQVHFFDVGQGDAAFIETPSGVQVLVDGGRDNRALEELGKVMSFFDRDIDMIIGTHPDLDHIGGLIPILKRYTVHRILTTENKGESNAALLYDKLKHDEGAEIFYARRGQEFILDASTTLRILFPETNPEEMESNTSSIVFQLIFDNTSFMFTGDSPKSIEEYLVLTEGEYLKSDVLKVGHHGSRTSTSDLFLDEVQPEFAIISAAKDNSYVHPHVEVTDLLFNTRVQTLETAEEGTITLLSDGARVWQKKQ